MDAIYLRYPGVTGDGTERDFEGQIALEGFNFEARLGPDASGQQVVQITKLLDRSSVPLARLIDSGKGEEVVVTFVPTPGATSVIRFVMRETRVESVDYTGTEGGAERPTEAVVLSFRGAPTWTFDAPRSSSRSATTTSRPTTTTTRATAPTRPTTTTVKPSSAS